MMTKQPEITVYSKTYCPYCVAAKNLLTRKGVTYTEINLDEKYDELKELVARTGLRTVPQIFIGGQLIGGYDDLKSLDEQKKLDALLAATP